MIITYAYISVAGEDTILCYRMDPQTGSLELQETVTIQGGPSPLAVDPTQRFLYVGLRQQPGVASFRLDPATGTLAHLGTSGLANDPCYIATDRTGRFLLASYYSAARVTIQAIQKDGRVTEALLQEIPTAQRAHCIQTDPTNRFVFVPHTAGPNLIFQFLFDDTKGHLRPNQPDRLLPQPGIGPRHFVFHPSLPVLYFSNEQGSSVTAYRLDETTGILTELETLSTLPPGYTEENSCAQIHIHPNGRFLYVSNRGHDSIAPFAIDPKGRLTTLDHQSTQPVPRVFNLDPSGSYLYAVGQDSGKATAYRIHAEAGTLEPIETWTVGERPMWVMLLSFDG